MSAAIQPGRFISFEGTEGVGKSTAIDNLCVRLDAEGVAYIKTREPGGSPFAEQLRSLLLDVKTQINDDTELLLMFAARSDHLQQVILPALAAGQWVICDRFVDSSVAYQGYGRGHGDAQMLAKIDSLIDRFVPTLPDLTLWLDLPVQEGMQRAQKRSAADRFEQQQLDFFDRVYQGFQAQQQAHPQRIQRVDAAGDAEQVASRIWALVQELRA
ncbi:dTMP kinase [Psychrobacter sp. FDAARGOS_221]|uniref:dTMP kinase n=1 Tax=Psychrobacter sp. FDAARGOS_221 TaxID=1975705 RepID=UPI000BB5737F|nr:dTMP kinase [Psychrobacter sp. FDAARGOS_221]PNK60615.1 dTMP kinase [Psychrobacter sp. FDAARGOS_221]